jgi:A/G-specific adenine glycosylase
VVVTANAATRLLQHYVDNFRVLPWRNAPGQPPPDPYRVWLSEIMLQQTTVAAVTHRFERFVARWPTLEALAGADDSAILSEWAGLGYYARARNLIACARQVAARGSFPETAEELCKLPGIGAYTAGAIAAIAFGQAEPAVDTNVRRVIARIHTIAAPAPGEIERLASAMMPADRPGDFIQALMDLGATTCLPVKPRCDACPVSSDCAAFAIGDPEAFPAKPRRRERPRRFGTAWWIERDGDVWLVRRPERGLLGGMASLPGSDWIETPETENGRVIGTVRHVFTHFTLALTIERRSEPVGEGWWQPVDHLADAGLPTLNRPAAELAVGINIPTRRAA